MSLREAVATRIARMARYVTTWYRDTAHLHVPRGAGKIVTEDVAYSVSAYWCCVRVIAETIAQMPWRVSRTTGTGRELVPGHPADRLLNRYPNPAMDGPVWRELMLRWLLSWGNAYCEILRDSSFRPVALWPIEPWRVTPSLAGGRLIYSVQQPGGEPVTLEAQDMLHFRGIGTEFVGWSVINAMARTLGLSAAQEESFASQMEHGTRLSGLLVPSDGGSIPKERALKLTKEWADQQGGSSNHGKVVLMTQGLDFKAMSMPNTDAQLLESRQFSVIDICRFMRVPPHKVYDLSRATFSNITHQGLEFLQDTLGPWIVKLEHQANRKLISTAASDLETQIDPTAILRMDPDTRIKYYQGLNQLGAISPNEVREREGLDGLGRKGDLYTVPVNLQPLERAREQRQQPTTPGPDPATIDVGNEQAPDPVSIEGNGNGRGRIRLD
jgi:HK97 family phage portal protein